MTVVQIFLENLKTYFGTIVWYHVQHDGVISFQFFPGATYNFYSKNRKTQKSNFLDIHLIKKSEYELLYKI